MNKKDLKLIGIIALAAVLIFGIFYGKALLSGPKEVGEVIYNNEVILTFDVNKNDIYEFEGAYGIMHLEVKDGKFRVVDVECPNHLCEGMGWITVDDIIPIVCIPNGIIVTGQTE